MSPEFSILYRHFLSTARICRFPVTEMETIIADLLQEMDGIIEQTAGGLPSDFPDDIARSVFDGMKQARDRLIRLRN
ncbi:MAG: hypothetical protein WC799_12540 [Desulfobacteraceae bacterium]